MRSIYSFSLLILALALSGCAILEGTKLAPKAVIEVIDSKGVAPFDAHLSGVASNDLYGEVVSYDWDFGDGSTGDDPIVTHTYRNPGTYVVSLMVKNSLGIQNTARATIVVKETPAPDAPVGLSAVTVSHNTIELSWSDRSDDEDGFEIQRSGPDSGFERIAEVDSNTIGYMDKDSLEPDTEYCYRIRAFNDDGESDFTSQSCTRTDTEPEFGDVTSVDENDVVSVTRTVMVGENDITVEVTVEAKATLELLAVVEKLESLELTEGELTTFVVNLEPGETLIFSYKVADPEEDGGSVLGTIRAKPLDEDSQVLELTSTLTP